MFPLNINAILSAIASAEQTVAANYEYSGVIEAQTRLRAAVASAIQKDNSEASGFGMELERLGRHTLNYFQEKARFDRQAGILKSQANEALWQVIQYCQQRVGKHAPVPARLAQDAKTWGDNALKVRNLRDDAAHLVEVAGWTGSAREQYSAAAQVQADAMTELHGVLTAAQSGAEVGGLLNRAIFYVVAKTIRLAAGRIESAPGRVGGQYYTRTARARNECYNLIGEIAQAANGEVAAGSSRSLSTELAKTLSLPNLLRVGSWPTGTSAAGTAPADTENTVNTGVDGTDLSAGGGSNRSTPGVNL